MAATASAMMKDTAQACRDAFTPEGFKTWKTWPELRKLLDRAACDLEAAASIICHNIEIPNAWKPIVHCPTDNSEWAMRLDDGTEFVGRWGTSQQRWQKRSEPEKYNDVMGNTIERVVWSGLPEGVYPSHFKPVQ